MRKFNVTGLCTPEEDYMVDISGKIAQIKQLIDKRSYFTINRARQYGKTTTLNELTKALADEYIVIFLSFQGIGDEVFASSELFCQTFVGNVAKALRFTNASDEYIKSWDDSSVIRIELLNWHITKMCENKKLVLIIDEVDRTSNNKMFLHFIDMLRDKFLARKAGRDYTFHSVILAGVYDIKNIKLKMINEGTYTPSTVEGKIFNSPWNIAVNFNVDMSFNATEIATMLTEYEADHVTGMDVTVISKEIYSYTNGYPFLVSRICQCIDEELEKDWTTCGIKTATRILLDEKSTLFLDLIKNLENNTDLYDLIYDVLIIGAKITFNRDNPLIELGYMYGIIKKTGQHVGVSNRIFEVRICDYFISKDEAKKAKTIANVLQSEVVRDGRFDMELALRKFADHYSEIFSESDTAFLERHGRLLFLSYLKPLINGKGFYHIESQLIDLRRMDIVVDYGQDQFIIELKLWKGGAYQDEAYAQLYGYLESKHADTGYLLTFDFRKDSNKVRKAEWVEVGGKRIFCSGVVIVQKTTDYCEP